MFAKLGNRAQGVVAEFKKFVTRGNVVDLAVGIIIGTAFKGITTSLVKDVITPPIGQLAGGLDFSQWVIPLDFLNFGREAAAEAATLNIGNFVNVTIDFLITAFAIFLLIKVVNKLDEAVDEIGDIIDGDDEPAPEPEPSQNPNLNRSRNPNPNRNPSRRAHHRRKDPRGLGENLGAIGQGMTAQARCAIVVRT